jgi:hypothetical protein
MVGRSGSLDVGNLRVLGHGGGWAFAYDLNLGSKDIAVNR